MTMRRALWGILFLLLFVPPSAHPASSDGFPWSNAPVGTAGSAGSPDQSSLRRDGYGALRDADMLPDTLPTSTGTSIRIGDLAPGGTATTSGISQGSIGATQSGPGATGLFTPDSPGNSAAYHAQMSGALEGSPIVDGNGANIRVTVPIATPSARPAYEQFSAGGLTGVFGTTTGAQSTRTLDLPGVQATTTVAYPSVTTTINAQVAPLSRVVSGASSLRPAQVLAPRVQAKRTTPLNASNDVMHMLGDVTGSMKYADGQIVLFGTDGTLRLNGNRSGTLTLSNGQVISFHDSANSIRQVAQRLQLEM